MKLHKENPGFSVERFILQRFVFMMEWLSLFVLKLTIKPDIFPAAADALQLYGYDVKCMMMTAC